MFVLVDLAGKASLEDRENFRAFKLVIEGGADRLQDARAALSGVAELETAELAWVSASWLRGYDSDDQWQERLSGMIEKARPHGWVHPQTGAIRAHVEYS